jgi:hypothetical protein
VALPREVEALRHRLAYDTPFWAENCAWIVTGDGGQKRAVRLKPRPWQARTPDTPAGVMPLDEALEKQRADGRPMRAIILKARKLGFSTWCQAKAMQRVTQLPFQAALTVAHRQDAAGALFNMAHLMYERLPSDMQLADLIYGEGTGEGAPFSVRPQKISEGKSPNGAKYLELGDRMRPAEKSIYQTMTAGAKGGGRASSPNIIHASEYGHWEDHEYAVGLFNAMPLTEETIGVVESTAKGFNHFHDMWQRAVAGAEDDEIGGTWTPLFYGWQHDPYHVLPLTDRARDRFERTVGDPDGGGDPEEIELVEVFGVTLEQLNWRRAIINGPEGGGSLEWFHQEHPATPEQAFIGSGRPVFPGILVARAIREAEESPKPVEGVLRGAEWVEKRTRAGSVMIPRRAVWVPGDALEAIDVDRWGSASKLRVWAHPLNEITQSGLTLAERRPDSQHVVFVDVAVGQGGTAGEGDWHALQVFDHVSRRQCASYRSRIPLHDLPLLVFLVGLYWNEAWIAVEVNNMGIGLVDALAKDYRYRLLYRRHRAGDDERTDARERLIGWQTDLRTKPLMEQTFGESLRDGTHGLRCVLTAREASTYVQDPKNPAKHGAQRGAHDDLLIAAMGAHRVMAEYAPRKTRERGITGWLPGDTVTGY